MPALTPYRAAYKESEITLAVGASTWWMRMRLELPKLRRLALLTGAVFGALGGIAMGFVSALGAPGSWLLPMFLVFLGLWLVPVLFGALVVALRTLDPPALEMALPALLAMRPTSVHVVPRSGEPFDSKWAFITAYSATPARIVLILSREPHLRIEIAEHMLSPAGRKTLLAWLEANQVPKDE